MKLATVGWIAITLVGLANFANADWGKPLGPGYTGSEVQPRPRFDATAVTAQVMVAAAKALPKMGPGAHSLLDVPLSFLWGDRRAKAEREWM